MVPVLMNVPNALKAVSTVTYTGAIYVNRVIITNLRQLNVYNVKIPI
jgi:hypothetical protein